MIRIWGRASSVNVQKVLWTAGELGLPFERIDAGGRYSNLDTPTYLALNPNARVPTIDDDGLIVWESNAIVRYFAAQYGKGTLWDADPRTRAAADQWMDWMQTTLAPEFYAVFWAVVRTPIERQDQTAIAELSLRLAERYRLVERQLGARPYLTGDRLSMADIAIGVTLYRYYEMTIERPALDVLRAWYERLADRAPYRRYVMTSFEELRGRLSN